MSESVVWKFFSPCSDDQSKAKCKCGQIFSRGKTPKTFSTKSLIDHLKLKHLAEFDAAVIKKNSANVNKESKQSSIHVLKSTKIDDDKAQQSIITAFEKNIKFHATHPRQIRLGL